MTGTTDTRITETLAFALECLHDVSIAAASVGYDPMEIQLPPLLNPGGRVIALLKPQFEA